MSVPSTTVVQATFAATLVDEWIRHGVADAIVCPGSRSTPLVLALARRSEIVVHVRIDERSAGFFALGRSLTTKVPVLVVVTSGTAATELHAAVAEADLAGVPLIVVTADRPPELHGVGAPQTLCQRDLFGPMVRRFEEPGVARDDARVSWRALASRLVRSAQGPQPGPVHLNAAFSEPLVGESGELPLGRENGAPWVQEQDSLVLVPIRPRFVTTRPLLVVGAGASEELVQAASEAGWIIAGDATGRHCTPYIDPILRSDEVAHRFAPDLVVRSGGLPASKFLQQRLAEWGAPIVAVASTQPAADPANLVSLIYPNSPGGFLLDVEDLDPQYHDDWRVAIQVANEVAEQLDDLGAMLSEPSLARLVVIVAGECDVPLVVGSSMPVRDVEWWSSPRRSPTYANRGANGIDGVTSTIFGVASGGSAIGFVGDITFLHDTSALVDGLGKLEGSCALVVADNGGGGIFSFLPQASEVDSADFNELFSTPRRHDLGEVARVFGHRSIKVTTNGEARAAIEEALKNQGVTVVVAEVPHHRDNVILHQELNELVGRLVGERLS